MKRWFLTAVRCVLPFLVYIAADCLVYAAVIAGRADGAGTGPQLLLAGICLNLLLIPAFLFLYRKDGIFEHRPQDRGIRVPLHKWAAAVAGTIAAEVFLTFLLFLSGITETDADFQSAESVLGAGTFFVQAAASVLIAPAAEELLFRGLFYRRLRECLPFFPALMISALGFGLFHGNLTQGINAFFMGLLLGTAYQNTGALPVPVTMHAAANAVSLLLFGTETGRALLADPVFFILLCAFCAASAAAYTFAFRKE